MLAMQEELARRKAEKEGNKKPEPEPEEYAGRKRRPPSPNPRGINLWAFLYADVCQKVSLADVEATFDQVDEDNGGTGMLDRDQLLLVCELLGLVCEEPSDEVRLSPLTHIRLQLVQPSNASASLLWT